MLTVEKEWNEEGELVFLVSGEIDENADLFSAFHGVPSRSVINTRDVTRINSVGLRLWIEFFKQFKSQEIQLRYAECSRALATHLSLIRSACGGTVDSVMTPFICAKCEISFEIVVDTPDIQAIKPQISGIQCPRCSRPAEIDEIPQDYFSFLLD